MASSTRLEARPIASQTTTAGEPQLFLLISSHFSSPFCFCFSLKPPGLIFHSTMFEKWPLSLLSSLSAHISSKCLYMRALMWAPCKVTFLTSGRMAVSSKLLPNQPATLSHDYYYDDDDDYDCCCTWCEKKKKQKKEKVSFVLWRGWSDENGWHDFDEKRNKPKVPMLFYFTSTTCCKSRT